LKIDHDLDEINRLLNQILMRTFNFVDAWRYWFSVVV